jgi:hypothetical protein
MSFKHEKYVYSRAYTVMWIREESANEGFSKQGNQTIRGAEFRIVKV